MYGQQEMKFFHERNRAIALAYFRDGKKKSQIGREYGISGYRVSQIIWKQEGRSKAWLRIPYSLMSHNPEGQLLDPDNDVNGRDCLHEWNTYTQMCEFATVAGEG